MTRTTRARIARRLTPNPSGRSAAAALKGPPYVRMKSVVALVCLLVFLGAVPSAAQTFSYRGFVDAAGWAFPQGTPNDPTRAVGDLFVRGELFASPRPWAQFAAGVDLRANSHDQVEDGWHLDFRDRGLRRPRLAVRRLSATFSRGPIVVDVGKQMIRWGRADLVTPTDHFAPRDFLNVVDSELIGVTAVRATVTVKHDSLEVVWVPQFTPSRMPLLDQRWTAVPPQAANFSLLDAGSVLPRGSQVGARWNHAGGRVEYGLSYFDGFNHLPAIETRPVAFTASVPGNLLLELSRVYPAIRSYGAEAAVPTRWLTVKGEVAIYTSSSPSADEYILHVVQLERQTGEWLVVGGYAGEIITARRVPLTFAPDRGLTRSFLGRAAYTIDANRSVAFEGVVRQNGGGAYVKAEYSEGRGAHWRATLGAALIGGAPDDFLGQYRRNSHLNLRVRYSF